MSKQTRRIVIVGGGTAGWIVAGLLAARYPRRGPEGLEITLVESPDQPTIGVGEGTWPTIRATLKEIGVSETDFLVQCEAAFKQASRFQRWVDGAPSDAYLHPFTAPTGYGETDLAPYWLNQADRGAFAADLCIQTALCDEDRAPKQITTPEYAGMVNYAYHLNAGKFGPFLRDHCVSRLGVTHVYDEISGVASDDQGDIIQLETRSGRPLTGDLFIDCTGFSSRLIGGHYQTPFLPKNDVLFIDTAWAAQVPYGSEDAPIASSTLSTAQSCGWIWDIGLSSRQGVGHVFSSAHISADKALEELQAYITAKGADASKLNYRQILIRSGYRQAFWVKNCVAVGLSAGFLEPLEASAIVMVELSTRFIADNLPRNRACMDRVGRAFNESFTYRWERIIDFLKLHYVLSRRTDSAFWIDNRRAESIPDSLAANLDFWRHHVPGALEFPQRDEIFSAASYQYVLYGMGFAPDPDERLLNEARAPAARAQIQETRQRAAAIARASLPNRELLRRIAQYGLQTV